MKNGSFKDCVDAVGALSLSSVHPVVVGVSGGLDSMVLMRAVVESLGAGRVVVATFDHGLREGSADEVEFVKHAAGGLGCVVETGAGNVPGEVEAGRGSVEEVARELRYRFFADVAQRHGASAVMTAHHADDQAETILFNLARGGGMDALAGMAMTTTLPAGNGVALIRPFLQLRREQLAEAAIEAGMEYREDPSNRSSDFTRNRIRNELLPLFSEVMARDVTDALVRNSGIIAEESAWLNRCAENELAEIQRSRTARGLDLHRLRNLATALRRRVLFTWLKAEGVADVSRRDVIAVDEVVMSNDKPSKVNLKGDLCARRRSGSVFVASQ